MYFRLPRTGIPARIQYSVMGLDSRLNDTVSMAGASQRPYCAADPARQTCMNETQSRIT